MLEVRTCATRVINKQIKQTKLTSLGLIVIVTPISFDLACFDEFGMFDLFVPNFVYYFDMNCSLT